jgi:twitching motility protein PilT
MPLRPIDRFISALHRQQGDEIVLESGAPGRIRRANEEKVLIAANVRTDQIELLLRDVLPEDAERSLRADGEATFPYRAPTGAVLIRAKRQGDRLAVSIGPYGATPARAPQPLVERNGRQTQLGGVAHSLRATMNAQPNAGVHSVKLGQIELVPPQAAIGAMALSNHEEAAGARPAPKSIPLDTGPIELDLATGSIPLLSPLEIHRLATADIVGPVTVGVPLDAAKVNAVIREATAAAAAAEQSAPPAPPPPVTRPRIASVEDGAKTKNRIDAILTALVRAKGSDLHMTAGLPPRMRHDGEMKGVPGFTEVLDSDTIESWLMEIAPQKSRAKFAATNDADYGYEISGLARLRCNAFRDRRGVGGVIRTIPAKVLSADQLGLPTAVRDLCTLAKGLVLVTGPTGSGKSTTLAAMIDLVNETRADHVITIEDPVEFVHQPKKCLINQREVHSDTESFSAGLRAALREDPDVILVGELRDLETIGIAIETAETGHLVFGTLHTNTALGTVDRIIDQFPTDRQQQIRVMLASSLKGVIAQTLCKKIGGGRVAALEIMLVVPAISNLIREGKTFQIASIMQTGRGIGMQTLNDALVVLVQSGQISPDEAMRVAVARNELKVLLDRANVTPIAARA